MPICWGPGPVFVHESIAATRRWQHYASRSLFVTSLLAALAFIWLFICAEEGNLVGSISLQGLAEGGEYIFYAISATQLVLVLLVAPAATAGAICLDRARGNLTHMLVTDLADSEVIPGKLAARLLPVLALVATTVPVLAISALLGGVVFEAIISLTLITIALAIMGCALALAVSVRSNRTHEVLVVVYAIESLWILSPLIWTMMAQTQVLPGIPGWLIQINPFVLAWSAYAWPDDVSIVWLGAVLGAMMLISAVCAFYAVIRLRAEVTLGSGLSRSRFALWVNKTYKRLLWWRPAPSLDNDHVLWREWRRGRTSRAAKMVWGLFFALSIAGLAAGIMRIDDDYHQGTQFLILASGFQATFGLLLVSLFAPTVLAEERVRGSLDVLMTTPLSTARIVMAKWRAAYRAVPALAILPAISCLVIVANAPEHSQASQLFLPAPPPLDAVDKIAYVCLPVAFLLAQGAAVTSVGLVLATWIRRIGRAVAVSVTICALFALGWIPFLEVGQSLFEEFGLWPDAYSQRPEDLIAIVGSACPLGGQYFTFETTSWPAGKSRLAYYIAQSILLLATIEFALILLALTQVSFDRCVGRVSERPRRMPRPKPPGRRSLLSAPHLLKSMGQTADRQR
jgi:ABC-type transport system involved in multi-copper enzyme maturation permease subunit